MCSGTTQNAHLNISPSLLDFVVGKNEIFSLWMFM